MFNSANLYLRQAEPTCRIASWSLNLAVERAMVHTRVDSNDYAPESLADTENSHFAPWPMHEHLAFGRDLIPTLVHSLEVTRRTKPCLQMLRSLEHLLSDPEHCLQALHRNVLKALTTLIIRGHSKIKLWAFACLRAIAGNPFGKTSIANQRMIMRQICNNFTAPEPEICEMVYTLLLRLSENWFVVPTLQKYNCIELLMKTLFTEVQRETLNEKRIACLLETLANMLDYKYGVQKAIRYDLFELTWLLTCGLQDIEQAMLKVIVRVANDELGKLGICYKMVGQQLLENFYEATSEAACVVRLNFPTSMQSHQVKAIGRSADDTAFRMRRLHPFILGTDPTLIGTVLMLATLPNYERDDYQRMKAVDVAMKILRGPNLSNPSKLALLRLLTNLAELPDGRKAMKNHLGTIICSQICDSHVRDAIAVLIKTTLSTKQLLQEHAADMQPSIDIDKPV